MSEKNRKMMYDSLVASGRPIPLVLKTEFGKASSPVTTQLGSDSVPPPAHGQVSNKKKAEKKAEKARLKAEAEAKKAA